jgi:hypothetical protein
MADRPSDRPDTPVPPGDDPQTAREELELDLMEADASVAGEQIGDEED